MSKDEQSLKEKEEALTTKEEEFCARELQRTKTLEAMELSVQEREKQLDLREAEITNLGDTMRMNEMESKTKIESIETSLIQERQMLLESHNEEAMKTSKRLAEVEQLQLELRNVENQRRKNLELAERTRIKLQQDRSILIAEREGIDELKKISEERIAAKEQNILMLEEEAKKVKESLQEETTRLRQRERV